jgi:hypothetical protein
MPPSAGGRVSSSALMSSEMAYPHLHLHPSGANNLPRNMTVHYSDMETEASRGILGHQPSLTSSDQGRAGFVWRLQNSTTLW